MYNFGAMKLVKEPQPQTDYTWLTIILLILILTAIGKFIVNPIIDKMPTRDLSEDKRDFYTDTWPPQ